MLVSLNLFEVNEILSTDENCYQCLSGIKWKNDCQCAKCGHRKYQITEHKKVKLDNTINDYKI